MAPTKNNTFAQLALFAFALLVIRFIHTGQLSFFFLLWNLFLALMPLMMLRWHQRQKHKWKRVAALGLVVLFLPNAPYILTDLFHLTKHLLAPLWFDTILILSFALLGLMAFLKAMDRLLKILRENVSGFYSYLFIKTLLFLSNGYGIYLGRYLRFNSWDIFCQPMTLVDSFYCSLFDPGHFKETLAVSFTFSLFLAIIFEIYHSYKKEQGTGCHDIL